MSEYISMPATKLVDIITKHNSHATSVVDAAVAEVTRRVAKGCKQPLTQEWLTQVLTAYAKVETIPRKSTVAKGFEYPKKAKVTPAPKGKASKVQSSSVPRFAEKKALSQEDLNFLFTRDAQETLACTFRPVS